MQTTEQEWAYIAGLFDGEGYFGVFKHTSPSFRERTKDGFVREYRISIANNSKELLEYVQKIVGQGIIYVHKRTNPNHATGYRLCFYPNSAREILPHVIPYLFLKKELAEIILEMLETIKKIHRIKKRKERMEKLNLAFDTASQKVTRIIKPNSIVNEANMDFWRNKE